MKIPHKDFVELSNIQKGLDDKILEGKGLDEETDSLFMKKVWALVVELGELSNEWQGFKFWKENQKPNTGICEKCLGDGKYIGDGFDIYNKCLYCSGSGKSDDNPLLEEYVDCLHFLLSIGNDLDIKKVDRTSYVIKTKEEKEKTVNMFMIMAYNALYLQQVNKEFSKEYYGVIFKSFEDIGTLLGFRWKDVKEAYYNKNEVNHARQANGY